MGHGSGDVFIGFTNEKLSSGSRKRETSFDFVLSGRSAGSGFSGWAAESVEESNLQFIDLSASGKRSRWKKFIIVSANFCQSVFEKGLSARCASQFVGGFCVEI